MKTLKARKYDKNYRALRKIILMTQPRCFYCKKAVATTLDHEPPLDSFPSPELWDGSLRPSCASCNYSRGAKYGNAKRKAVKNSRKW